MTDSIGILDTCVLIDVDLGVVDVEQLPDRHFITTITLAELSAGPLVARTSSEQAVRQLRLQKAEALYAESVLALDAAAARCFGRVFADVLSVGRTPRRRIADLQIAAIAIVQGLALYTINVDDFQGIDGLNLIAVQRSN